MAVTVTKEIITEVSNLHKEMLDTVERSVKETKTAFGQFEVTTQAKFDKLNVRLDELELKHIRPYTHAAKQLQKNFNEKRKNAFDNWMRKGSEDISPEEKALIRSKEGFTPEQLKMLTEGDAQGGGFFVVPEYVQDIVKSVVLISRIRNYAKIRTTRSNVVKQPKRTGTMAATWTAEANKQSPASGLTYGIDEVPNHAMTAIMDISLEDLEDSMFDMAGEIQAEVAEQFARAEGASFVNGTGKGQPEGFMNNSSLSVDITNNATGFSPQGDEFTTCSTNMKSDYAKIGLTWFLNRQTLGKIRLLKDSQNRPIWLPFAQSGLSEGLVPQIAGIPYEEVPDMPQVGAGTYPVVLGCWPKAYLIVDRLDITMQRDPYILGDSGAVRFRARKRVGGQVILAEAIRKIMVTTNTAYQSGPSL